MKRQFDFADGRMYEPVPEKDDLIDEDETEWEALAKKAKPSFEVTLPTKGLFSHFTKYLNDIVIEDLAKEKEVILITNWRQHIKHSLLEQRRRDNLRRNMA